MLRIPNLRFVIEDIYQGIDTIVIAYRNQDGGLVSEVLRFSGDLVIEGRHISRSRVKMKGTAPPLPAILQGGTP